MPTTITPVRRMADLPDDLAENVRAWPHYQATSETHPDDRYPVTYREGQPDEHTIDYDPLVSENGERGGWRLTGYAEAGTTADGYRLFILRMNRSTFTWGYMAPGSTSLNIGAVTSGGVGAKASVEQWIADTLALDLTGATEAGTIAYNVGRPCEWRDDPRMRDLVTSLFSLAGSRLVAAYRAAWEDNANHDRARDHVTETGCGLTREDFHPDGAPANHHPAATREGVPA